MIDELGGKVAVVTGGGSGIGQGIARALAAAGADVVIADIDLAAAEAAASELSSETSRTMAVRCDVSELSSVEHLADQAWDTFGHVDVAVNNAGVFPRPGRLVEGSEADARWVLDVNVMGVWNGCHVFGRRFVAQGTPAHIVNTGSENSLGIPHTRAAMYTASKHAVLGLSDVLRRELPSFVGVSILCPGVVPTRLGSATRNRQERYGGAEQRAAAAASGVGVPADEIGERVVASIRRGDFYILTHPPVRELVDERYEELTRAFDSQAPRYGGDEAIDTRRIIPWSD